MTDINLKFSVQIPGGPTIQDSQIIGVEAYASYEVSLLPESSIEVTVLPADVTGHVKLFLIQSSLYSNVTDQITYSIDKKVPPRQLDAPQLFLGSGAIDTLGPPQKITFKNTLKKSRQAVDKAGKSIVNDKNEPVMEDLTKTNTAKITILVGRDAAAEPKEEPKEKTT